MKPLVAIAIAIAFALVTQAQASKEGILALSSFRMESSGIASSGKIVVEGRQDGAQIVELKIRAFNKDYVVPDTELAKLSNLRANGVRISFEQGYREIGGRAVYVHLQTGFISSTKKEALITIFEDGQIEVGDVRVRQDG